MGTKTGQLKAPLSSTRTSRLTNPAFTHTMLEKRSAAMPSEFLAGERKTARSTGCAATHGIQTGETTAFSRSNEESTNVVSNPKWSAAFRLASLSGIQCFFRRELFKLLFNDSTFKL